MNLNWLLPFIPVAFVLEWLHVNPVIVFLASALAIIPLASLMEKATEALAHYLGPTLGGLLSATMGNAPELIIGVAALRNGLIDVLKSSIAGSVLGTLLFGIGITIVFGGLRRPVQTFDGHMVAMNSTLLMIATFGLIVPAAFHFSQAKLNEELSLEISVILLLAYVASLVYTLFSHRPTVGKAAAKVALEESGAEPALAEAEAPRWSRGVWPSSASS
jgi:Ca2+:H+ antiporter